MSYNLSLLDALIIVLLVMWALGQSFASSVGSIIHLLLVIAVIVIIIRLLRGQSI